jgi:hypothetical protein
MMGAMQIFHRLRSSLRVANDPGVSPSITASALLRTEELALGGVGPNV